MIVDSLPFIRIDQNKTPVSDTFYTLRYDISVLSNDFELHKLALEIAPQHSDFMLTNDVDDSQGYFTFCINVKANVANFIRQYAELISSEAQKRGVYVSEVCIVCDEPSRLFE